MCIFTISTNPLSTIRTDIIDPREAMHVYVSAWWWILLGYETLTNICINVHPIKIEDSLLKIIFSIKSISIKKYIYTTIEIDDINHLMFHFLHDTLYFFKAYITNLLS